MRSRATSWMSNSRCCSCSTRNARLSSTTPCSRTPTRCPRSNGARTAAPSPSNTTSAATRSIASSRSMGRPAPHAPSSPKSFFTYRTANGGLADSGKEFRFDVDDGKEIVWMSERDGWNHLYLFDGVTGAVKNQITRGNWVVRGVQHVDPATRQIWFSAGGMYPGKDPYFADYYRINFDGSGLTRLTGADANHTVAFSTEMKFYVDTYSRI